MLIQLAVPGQKSTHLFVHVQMWNIYGKQCLTVKLIGLSVIMPVVRQKKKGTLQIRTIFGWQKLALVVQNICCLVYSVKAASGECPTITWLSCCVGTLHSALVCWKKATSPLDMMPTWFF